MDMFKESDLRPAEDRILTVQDTGWNICPKPDRRHADVLLNISEDSFATGGETYEFNAESGWEEAIQGWGRSPPLACLFQIQKKSKKSKAADSEYHCLLCLDVNHLKPVEPDQSTHSELQSSEKESGSDQWHQSKGITSSDTCPKRLSIHPLHTVTDHHALEGPTKQAKSDKEISEDTKLLMLEESSLESANAHDLIKECPLMKERCRNVPVVINSFTVLPPVKADCSSNLMSPNLLKRTEAILNRATAQGVPDRGGSHAMLAAGEKAGVDRMWEISPHARKSDVPEASYRPFVSEHCGLPHWHCPFQASKQLQSPSGMQNWKKCDPPFNVVRDMLPQAAYPLVRNLKYEDLGRVSIKNNHGHRLYIALKSKSVTETKPQLPALLGTRVPLPASSHRLL